MGERGRKILPQVFLKKPEVIFERRSKHFSRCFDTEIVPAPFAERFGWNLVYGCCNRLSRHKRRVGKSRCERPASLGCNYDMQLLCVRASSAIVEWSMHPEHGKMFELTSATKMMRRQIQQTTKHAHHRAMPRTWRPIWSHLKPHGVMLCYATSRLSCRRRGPPQAGPWCLM